jgi:hypothetical protein
MIFIFVSLRAVSQDGVNDKKATRPVARMRNPIEQPCSVNPQLCG